ncbi:MAG: O-antigen ligase family protein [Gammaproteobacteria bacterium]|nr:O-antigen ligase family protein [Gammaproteobacteria bacterium]
MMRFNYFRDHWRRFTLSVTFLLFILFGFCLPIALAPQNMGFGLAVFAAFISGEWWRQRKILLNNKMICVLLLLISLFAAGIFYGDSTFLWKLKVFKKELGLLTIVFLLPIVVPTLSYLRICLYAYIIGCLVVVAIAFLGHYALLPHWHVFQNPGPYYAFFKIYGAMLVTFGAFISFHLLCQNWSNKLKWCCLLLIFILLSYNVLWQSDARTGYLEYIALAVVFLLFYPWRRLFKIVAILLVIIASVGVVKYSQNFSMGMMRAFNNVSLQTILHPHTSNGVDGSTSTRIVYLHNSYTLWKQAPFFGHGTGGFRGADIKIGGVSAAGVMSTESAAQTTPEQTYARILVEQGIVGLTILLVLWGVQLFYAFKLNNPMRKNLAIGVVVTMLLASFSQDLLKDESPRLFYIYFTSLLFAPLVQRKGSET